VYDRLRKAHYPLTGASDHLVSEALYLNDPDENGVELYWDKPREFWEYKEDGSIKMDTLALALDDLLSALDDETAIQS
jgi:catechol 2,3-dioxygenase